MSRPNSLASLLLDESTVDRVISRLRSDEVLGELSALRIGETLRRFVVFTARRQIIRPEDLVAASQEFIAASIRDRSGVQRPSVSTMHVRRTSLRIFFRALVADGVLEHDPTTFLALPPRSESAARPLSDEEISLCRSASLSSLIETRLPATWALAEASARSAELFHVTLADVDLAAGRVWIHGASKTTPRWGQLDDWALQQVTRRVELLKKRKLGPETPLTYGGRSTAGVGQAAVCTSIATVLTRAGLRGRDVRPVSVTAWVGQQVLAESGRIEVVAQRLGMRSLDRAARLIGWDWTQSV